MHEGNSMTDTAMRKLAHETIQRFLGQGSFRLFLAGSRSRKVNSPWSDYDFVLKTADSIDPNVWLALLAAIDELPTLHGIDLVDWSRVSVSFQKVTTPDLIEVLHDGQLGGKYNPETV
jgi:hypothetical protein